MTTKSRNRVKIRSVAEIDLPRGKSNNLNLQISVVVFFDVKKNFDFRLSKKTVKSVETKTKIQFSRDFKVSGRACRYFWFF